MYLWRILSILIGGLLLAGTLAGSAVERSGDLVFLIEDMTGNLVNRGQTGRTRLGKVGQEQFKEANIWFGLTSEFDVINTALIIDQSPSANSVVTPTAEDKEGQTSGTPDPVAIESMEARATATIVPFPFQELESVQTLAFVSVFSTMIGLIAIVFLVVVWRKPRVRRRATEFVSGSVQAVTEPFFGARRGDSKAHLVLITGDSSVPQRIDLYRDIMQIGRDPAMAVDIILNDRRISRLHAKIIKQGSQFELMDEGSTGGTWVNDVPIPMTGQILREGDEINFGPIRYRFATGVSNPTQTARFENMGEKTESFWPGTVGAEPTQAAVSEDMDENTEPYWPDVGDTQWDLRDPTRIPESHSFDLRDDLVEIVHQTGILRYTDVRLPQNCRLGVTVNLLVNLTKSLVHVDDEGQLFSPKSADVALLSLRATDAEIAEQMVEITVMVYATALHIDHPWQVLYVPLDADPEPVEFRLTPQQLGEQLIEVEFLHGTARVGYVVVKTEVVDDDTD